MAPFLTPHRWVQARHGGDATQRGAAVGSGKRFELGAVDVMFIGLRSVNGAQGGVERHVGALVEEFEALGLRTCTVVRHRYAPEGSVQLGRNSFTRALWAPRNVSLEAPAHSVLATLWAGLVRPKVLHVHAIGPSIVVPLARAMGLRVVCTHHGSDYDREKWGGMAKAVLRFGEWCQGHMANGRICVSRGLAQSLSDRFGRHFSYIPNAVNLPQATRSRETLDKFGLKAGGYIVHVGRLVPEKRQDDLIRAFARLQRPDLKLVLVGGVDHASAYSKELAALAAATPGVIMTGFQKGEALVQLLGNAAVFALPSSHEGMPIAALEAMSLGRPVVLSDIAANMDLGLPAVCYHMVGSVEDLADKIARSLDRYGHQEVPAHDWSEVMSSYSWPIVAQQTLDVYCDAAPALQARMAALSP
ncbi:Glycosyl transferase group 1 [Devosia sp. LC5]|uniref:glycosyltransferase family 4 protein n=1 Tax=Devosia sp. LC5 TaxID=1502724 RepID=UPI0004E43C83|nr:glycosyltransferase family 4 protein [Devosia sp. LC5]KFC62695.1 Glycosyl transferase group 1 [Devosia sp. LC5]